MNDRERGFRAGLLVLALGMLIWPRLALVGEVPRTALAGASVNADASWQAPAGPVTGRVYGLMQISTGGQNRGYNPALSGWGDIAGQVIANWRRAESAGRAWDGLILYRPDGIERRAGLDGQMRFDGAVYRKQDAVAGTAGLKPAWGNDADLVRAFIAIEDAIGVQPMVYVGAVSVIPEWDAALMTMTELDAKVRESVSWLHLYRQLTGRPLPCIILDDSGRWGARSTPWAVRLCLERQGFARVGSEVTHRGSPWIGDGAACSTITSGLYEEAKSGIGGNAWYPAKPGELGHEEIILCSGRHAVAGPMETPAYVRGVLATGRSVALNLQGGTLPRDVK